MVEKDRLDFVRRLGTVYNDAWDDEALRNQLIAEPRTVLAEHGIELPASVKVEAQLVQAPEPSARSLDDFVAEWERMVKRGTVELKVPASRPPGVKTTELSDEDLERVAGGQSAGEVFKQFVFLP